MRTDIRHIRHAGGRDEFICGYHLVELIREYRLQHGGDCPYGAGAWQVIDYWDRAWDKGHDEAAARGITYTGRPENYREFVCARCRAEEKQEVLFDATPARTDKRGRARARKRPRACPDNQQERLF